MEREQHNPHFRFMFDSVSAEHLYYRWKVVSLCTGGLEDAVRKACEQSGGCQSVFMSV